MEHDVLSDVLGSLRANGTVYFCDQLQAPWTKEYPGEEVASFHQLRRGSCWLTTEGEHFFMGPGDVMFLAPGRAHILSSQGPDASANGAEPATLLLCGYCRFDEGMGLPFNELFPDISILRDEQLQLYPQVRSILDTVSAEFLSMRPGSRIVVNKLTEVLLVELIRINFGRNEQLPLLEALSDRPISAALRRLHSEPSRAWTLESLAAEVGLSRAGFAKRFRDLVRYPMFEYLTRLRLQRACELLEDTNLPLYQVANHVGYDSDLAFTRTFRKRMGVTPTAFRKTKRTERGSSTSKSSALLQPEN